MRVAAGVWLRGCLWCPSVRNSSGHAGRHRIFAPQCCRRVEATAGVVALKYDDLSAGKGESNTGSESSHSSSDADGFEVLVVGGGRGHGV